MTRKVSLFLFTTLLFSCGSIYNLNGTWIATGYECPNHQRKIEIIEINQDRDSVIATKLEGDHCIEAGEITFLGEIRDDKIVGVMNAGNPTTKERIQYPMEMIILNNDSLVLEIDEGKRITFSREI